MKIAYFDCFAGAAGNMILGSLIDAGCDIKKLTRKLSGIVRTTLGLSLQDKQLPIAIQHVTKYGISGTYFNVETIRADGRLPQLNHHRNLSDITKIINGSKLKAKIRSTSINIFTELAKAEAKVHGININKVHFHEVGALDAIIDIVGTVIALDILKIDKVFCSPLPISHGKIKCAHGILPVPAPATSELLKGIPSYKVNINGEMITPTGAAILKTLATFSEDMPEMKIKNIGYGAGSNDLGLPPFLRIFIGKESKTISNGIVFLLETNIDDMNPQIYDYAIEKLFSNGALDVWLENIQMKKNRPGQKLSVLCKRKDINSMARIILTETTAIGIRYIEFNRVTALRNIITINTKYGKINTKESSFKGEVINISPEYEDCKIAAKKYGIPLKDILSSPRPRKLGHPRGVGMRRVK